jgi:YegS/Rv2252/BmrU family lipid kinase
VGRSALLIANPAAGFRSADERAERAAARLKSLGFAAELYRTQGPHDAERAAREASRSFDIVLAAGGDGTLHEVANGLARTDTPMGLVPLGSMNILARELRMPLDVDGACEWLARAQPRPIALGEREGRYFVLMAGIGYDAFALEGALERAREAGRKVRFSDYVIVATLGAHGYEFPEIAVEADGWKGTGAFAFVANCARYGANLRIARDARLEEPLLDLVLLRSGRLRSRLRYFGAVLTGTQGSTGGVVYRKARTITLRSEGGPRVPCQLDGECSAPLPGIFQAVPEALLLLRSAGDP